VAMPERAGEVRRLAIANSPRHVPHGNPRLGQQLGSNLHPPAHEVVVKGAVAELSVGPLYLARGTRKRFRYRLKGEWTSVIPLDGNVREQIQPTTLPERSGPQSRWRSAHSCGGWHSVQTEVQAEKLMNAPTAEIESLGNLIEGEAHDHAQPEHFALALCLDMPAVPGERSQTTTA
jgi:hypothetical protein